MAYIYDLVDTWNNSGVTFTAIKMNVTDTASSASSMLMDLQVGGTSRFKIEKSGTLITNSSTFTMSEVQYNGATRVRFINSGNNGSGIEFWRGEAIQATFTAINNINSGGISWNAGGGVSIVNNNSAGISISSLWRLQFSNDLELTRRGAANLRLGAADAAVPVAQTLSVQSVATGTANTAGANWTFDASQGTGLGAGGSIIFRVAPAAATSNTTQNALQTALTIDSSKNSNFTGNINVGVGGFGEIAAFYGAGAGVTLRGYSTGIPLAAAGLSLSDNHSIAWGTTLFIGREAANVLAQRNGTNSQAFRIYNTFTDSSNFERGFMRWNSNVLQIGTENAGTGSARSLVLQTNGTTRFTVDTNDNFIFGSTFVNKAFTFTNVGYLYGRASGVFQLSNATDNGFDRLQFGGTTSAFPALKRSGAALQVRLADDSAAANLTAARIGVGTENPEYTLHVAGDSYFNGNVTISGLTSFMNAETLLIGDNYIVLNADLPNTSPALESAGIEVKRGTSGNASIIWDETSSEWDIKANNTTVAAFTQSGSIRANTGVALTASNPVLDLVQQWNNSGVAFTGLKLNVIDTASSASSSLMDIQVGGNSRFNVLKNGDVRIPTSLNVGGDTFGFMFKSNGVHLGYAVNAMFIQMGGAGTWGVTQRSDGYYAFSSTSNASDAKDVAITRRASNSLRLGLEDISASATITVTIATPGIVTWNNHSLSTGTPIIFTTTGALPTGIVADTTYYAIVLNNNSFQIATSFANALSGTAINTSGSQSGTHTGRRGAVAQTFGPQDTLSTASLQNIDGANFVIRGSRSIGDKPGGSIIFQVSPAGTSGTAQNALVTAMTIASDRNVTFDGGINTPALRPTSGNDLIFNGASVGAAWRINTAGNFIAHTDNTYDIGASGANRPRAIYTSGNISVGNDLLMNMSIGANINFGTGYGSINRGYSGAHTFCLSPGSSLNFAVEVVSTTNPMSFRIYNTFTDPSNYERGRLQWLGNEFRIGTEAAGTGTIRSVGIYSGGTRYQIIGGGYTQFDQNIYMNVANIVTGGTGFKIGTASNQKIGFWNATPIEQPNTSVTAATVASTGTGDVVAATTTFDGYTIPQIVKALRNAGLLA